MCIVVPVWRLITCNYSTLKGHNKHHRKYMKMKSVNKFKN